MCEIYVIIHLDMYYTVYLFNKFCKIFCFVVSKVWRVTLKDMGFKRNKKKRKMSNISYYNHLKNKSNTRGVEIGLEVKEKKDKLIFPYSKKER